MTHLHLCTICFDEELCRLACDRLPADDPDDPPRYQPWPCTVCLLKYVHHRESAHAVSPGPWSMNPGHARPEVTENGAEVTCPVCIFDLAEETRLTLRT